MDSPIGPLPSEEDFFFTLQLSEGPSNFSHPGISQWKMMYRMASETQDSRTMISAVQNIYTGLNSAGRAGEALLCARRLLSLGSEVNDALVIGHALNNIAWAYWVMGDHISALHVSKEAFNHATTLSGKPLIHPLTGSEEIRASTAELLRLIGQSQGYLRRGIADREAMLRVYRERNDFPRIVSSLEGLGLVNKDLGDYSEASIYFKEALHLVNTGEFLDGRAKLQIQAGLLGNLGVIQTHQGDATNALAFIEEAIQIYQSLSDQFGLIGALGQKGRALLHSGQIQESIDTLKKMYKLSSVYNANSWSHAAHFNLARAYLTNGQRIQAARHCEYACTLAKEKLGHISIGDCWLRAVLFHPLSTRKASNGDMDRFVALAYHAVKALHDAIRRSLPGVVVRQWIDAFEILLDAVCLGNSNKPFCLSKEAENTDGQTTIKSIEDAAQNSPFVGWLSSDISLYCAESLRAQEFHERLLLNTSELKELHDPNAIEELARVEAELEELQSTPPIVVNGTVSFNEDGHLVENGRESIESITRQEEAQENYMRRREELLKSRDRHARNTIESFDSPVEPLPTPARLSDLREVLNEDELVLEFVLLGQTEDEARPISEVVQWPNASRPQAAYVIAITKSWNDIIPLGPTKEIESSCMKLLDMLDRLGELLSLSFYQSEAANIYDLLLRPVWSRGGEALRLVRHLVIAPDGLLHKMPLDLLVEDTDEVSKWNELSFIVRRFTTEYTPSATFLVHSRQGRYSRGKPGSMLVGLGDPMYSEAWQPPFEPLPGTRKELDLITPIFRKAHSPKDDNQVRLLLDAEASKAHLINAELLQRAAYLHIGCHGSAGTPPFTDGALYLAQQPKAKVSESVLTSQEVMNLRTNAKLVVLSACESGLGTLSRGEGIQGLTRAWLFAGAQAVVSTFWRVDDKATAELMGKLYEALLLDNGSIANALAEAKRTMLDSERFACPVFWGAFFVTGGRAMESSISSKSPNDLSSSNTSHSATQPALTPLNHQEHELLRICASTWESSWERGRLLRLHLFCEAAARLVDIISTSRKTSDLSTSSPIGLVARNCRMAWEYCARNHMMAIAIKAHHAYSKWAPSTRTKETDALASAYQPENLATVRRLTREGRLKRTFELSVSGSLDVTLRTTFKWIEEEAVTVSHSPIEVALPADPSVTCEEGKIIYCHNSEWAVFSISPGETIHLTEQLLNYVVNVDDDTLVIGGTWGSRIIPHDLTIRLHSDFIPFRFQQEELGKQACEATVKFTTNGAVITLRTATQPWLCRIGLVFKRVPGALEMFAAPNSPFLSETEFGQFERLIQQAQMQS